MKRLCALAALLAALLFTFNACGNKNPAAPVQYTATLTSTSFIPPTITDTWTVTPTETVSPTCTITMTETPFIIDDFEDNDIYNNINPSNNAWSSFANTPDAASNTYTVFSFGICLNCGTSSSHALNIVGVSFADNPDGSGNYFSTYGMSTPVLFAPSTGINFTIYKKLIFNIVEHVWVFPSSGSYGFRVELFDNNGRRVQQDMTASNLLGWAYQQVPLDISAFTVPAGVSAYTPADVLPNIVEIRWEYWMVSPVMQDTSQSTMSLDGIYLEK
jgi:hypothetical protein